MISRKNIIRYYAVAAAIWLLPASCCHSSLSDSDEGTEDGPPIMIDAATPGTKAVVNSTGHLGLLSHNSGKGFGVYGYKKNANDTYTLLFNNMEVKSTPKTAEPYSESTVWEWTYTPTRYWDSNPLVSYQFVAYWPKLPKSSEIAENSTAPNVDENGERVLTIYNIPNWQDSALVDQCNDYLTSQVRGHYKSTDPDIYLPFISDNYVHFNFQHLLSKLTLRGYYVGVQDNIIYINSLSLNGTAIPVFGGYCKYTEPFEGQDDASYTFDKGPSQPVLYSKSGETGLSLADTYFNTQANPAPKINSKTICKWLVVPSTGWGNIKLEVNYSIINESIGLNKTYVSDITGISFDSDENHPAEMLASKSYGLTLKFDSADGGIELQGVWVNDWTTQPDISQTVYNW